MRPPATAVAPAAVPTAEPEPVPTSDASAVEPAESAGASDPAMDAVKKKAKSILKPKLRMP